MQYRCKTFKVITLNIFKHARTYATCLPNYFNLDKKKQNFETKSMFDENDLLNKMSLKFY